MPSDLVVGLPTVEEMTKSVSPSYIPFSGILTKRKTYIEKIGDVNLNTVAGDESEIFSSLGEAIIGSQETEVHSVKTSKTKKNFYKRFRGHKYTESNWQAETALPELNDRVIRAYTKYWDRSAWLGSDGNNGIYTSSDANYVLNAGDALAATPTAMEGINALMASVSDAIIQSETNVSSSDLKIGLYGSTLLSYLDKLIPNSSSTYMSVLKTNFPNVQFSKVPNFMLTTAATENGFVVLANDLITLHLTTLPKIINRGMNDENSYAWVKYVTGNTMVDPMELGAIIRQPITFS